MCIQWGFLLIEWNGTESLLRSGWHRDEFVLNNILSLLTVK